MPRTTFVVKGGKGVFDGVCRIVPSLKAPGFCNAEARPGITEKIADASAFIEGGLEIELTSSGNLTQFKAAFGNRAEHSFGEAARCSRSSPCSCALLRLPQLSCDG